MPRTLRDVLICSGLLAIALAVPVGSAPAAPEKPSRFENLQVLSGDLSRGELSEVMLDILRGLGLPRLAGEGCLYCHVGDIERPRKEWDYASDDKPTKRTARAMLAMTEAINRDLGTLEDRIAPGMRVTCRTCHAGRTDPRPLDDRLRAAYEEGGVAGLRERYEALRTEHFASDAYDFRPRVLAALARELAATGAMADAQAVAELNVEHHPDDPSAKRAWVALVLEEVVFASGAEAGVEALDRLAPTLAAGVVTPNLLDALGWHVHRAGRAEVAMTLFEHNRARFPDAYVPTESLAWALHDTGAHEAAYTILEAWIEAHPDHDRSRRLLVNLRAPKTR